MKRYSLYLVFFVGGMTLGLAAARAGFIVRAQRAI
jgi:hypothetical protein